MTVLNVLCMYYIILIFLYAYQIYIYIISLSKYLTISLDKFDWGVWCLIIFLHVQFGIRLAAVS